MPGHPAGPRTAFLNAKAPPGSTHYPVGTIIVKQIETNGDPDMSKWDLFAMVKRGGDFNPEGRVIGSSSSCASAPRACR